MFNFQNFSISRINKLAVSAVNSRNIKFVDLRRSENRLVIYSNKEKTRNHSADQRKVILLGVDTEYILFVLGLMPRNSRSLFSESIWNSLTSNPSTSWIC